MEQERFPTDAEVAQAVARANEQLKNRIIHTSSYRMLQDTGIDTIGGKYSATKKGYFRDGYMEAFVQDRSDRNASTNRGFFLRVLVFETIVRQFTKNFEKSNVVVLGSGFDTLFFRLPKSIQEKIRWVELDLAETVAKKKRTLINDPLFNSYEFDHAVSRSDSGLDNGHYALEICNLSQPPMIDAVLNKCAIDRSLPTLVLAECVLVYLKKSVNDDIMKYFTHNFPKCALGIYEMVGGNDLFAYRMIEALADRGIHLPLIQECKFPTDYDARFENCGFERFQRRTMFDIFENWVPMEIQDKVQNVDPLFDLEEEKAMKEMMEHYSFTITSKGLEECASSFHEHIFQTPLDVTEIQNMGFLTPAYQH